MDNKEDFVDAQLGTREKRIYTINTYVNQDGFKVEKHVPIEGDEGDRLFYGFYLVNTEIGPIDRYFKFNNEADVEECFENFKSLAEADARKLAEAMKAESERLDREDNASPRLPDDKTPVAAPVENDAPRTAPIRSQASPPPPERDAEVLDTDGLHI